LLFAFFFHLFVLAALGLAIRIAFPSLIAAASLLAAAIAAAIPVLLLTALAALLSALLSRLIGHRFLLVV
jgi:hypothetical protein